MRKRVEVDAVCIGRFDLYNERLRIWDYPYAIKSYGVLSTRVSSISYIKIQPCLSG